MVNVEFTHAEKSHYFSLIVQIPSQSGGGVAVSVVQRLA
jgi:hypothetical protein